MVVQGDPAQDASDRVTPMRWPLIKYLPEKTNFAFVRLSRVFAVLSLIAVIASGVSVFWPGLPMGIDFRGGTVLEMEAPRPIDLAQVRGHLADLNLGDVQVQAFGDERHAMARFQTPEGANANQTITRVKDTLSQVVPNVTYPRTEVVGAKVSGELLGKGVLALAVAIGLMLVYIWFRFELQFGVGAVVALFHDVILTFGMIVLFRFEFSLNLVAGVLTIIGYSMNDTVVIFDRMRENLRKYKRMPLRELIDLSINETLSRTIITGLTAVMALGGLAVLGGESLRPLSLILIGGIILGTYSSIYVAAPVLLLWGVKRGEEAEPLKPATQRP
jgi:preprotein translocase SecF subunit